MPLQAPIGSRCDQMPFEWCNLSRNPFGELTREERAELAVVDVQFIANTITENQTAVQLIGECGRGKTTHMLALQRVLPASSYSYLPEDRPCPGIAVGRPILIDEAQRLSKRAMQTVFSSGIPLVLATHRDLERSLRKFGYRVYTAEIGTQNDAQRIHCAMNLRIKASRLDDQAAVPELSIGDAQWLQARFGSDLRAIETYLYDQIQTQAFQPREENHGKVRFVD